MAKTKAPGKRPIGRPKVQVKEQDIKLLAFQGHTDIGIGHALGISQSTLQRFRGVLQAGRTELENALRAKQVERALAGDGPMLKWLGIQLCGQRSQIGVSGPDGGPVQTESKMVTVDM